MNLIIEKAKDFKAAINNMTINATDEVAVNSAILYDEWDGNSKEYKEGLRLRYNGVLYKVNSGQSHTSQADWTPDTATSLFSKVLIPGDEHVYEWEQPESTNPYMAGDKVTHNNKTWVSDVDNNVWEPGVYGWTEVE